MSTQTTNTTKADLESYKKLCKETQARADEMQADLVATIQERDDLAKALEQANDQIKYLSEARLRAEPSIESAAGNPSTALPNIELVPVYDRDNNETLLAVGKVVVTEESSIDSDGKKYVTRPGMVGVRRTIRFEHDSTYNIDSLRSRIAGIADVLLAPALVGPIDQSLRPTFEQWPPFNGKRVLDVTVVVR